jgi:hypothetical protein
MPKIQWKDLPPPLRDHLFERLRERKITAEDLYQLKLWRETEPEAPEGPRYKEARSCARSRKLRRGGPQEPRAGSKGGAAESLCRCRLEGIEETGAASRDIGDVPGHEGQPVHLRGCRQEAIDDGQGVGHVHPAPLISDLAIDP